MYLKHIFLSFLIISCNNFDMKNILKPKKVIYYEDIDFFNFEGINPVNKVESETYIEIVSKDQYKVVLEIHSRFEKTQLYYSKKEIFTKKGSCFFQYKEDDSDVPNMLIKEYTYIKDGFILRFENTTYKNEPQYSRITKITPSKNFIEEIEIEEELVEPNPDIDFNSYKSNSKVFTVTEKKLEIKNDKLVVYGKIINHKYKENSKTYITYYEGYPNTLRINNYWNLYKYFLGQDIPDRSDMFNGR